jgi:hypothetical protein
MMVTMARTHLADRLDAVGLGFSSWGDNCGVLRPRHANTELPTGAMSACDLKPSLNSAFLDTSGRGCYHQREWSP